jgi:ABC-type spermidine/putrescine transport system permease subunit II
MPELYVEPQTLADAGRTLATERSVLSDVADALAPALGVVAAALPGSRTAVAAGHTATTLTAAVRAAAAELDQLARAVTAAARDYRVVEQTTAAGIERDGRAAT